MQSILTKNQKKILVRESVHVNGTLYKRVGARVRFDDSCGNGHNSFSITGSFYRTQRQIDNDDPEMVGCCHDELVRVFPELKHLFKWHLCSTDGPVHYIANTTYHAKNGALDAARRCAVWPDATLEQLQDRDALQARLPQLLADMKADIEAFGFTW